MNRLLFSKTGDAIYLSHLDLMRVFQRAFRRADILIWHSQGFSPRAYVSIALPLPVGTKSRCEILDFEIEDGAADLKALAKKLNAVLPEGIRVEKAYESKRKIKELSYLKTSLTLEYDRGFSDDAPERLQNLFARDGINILKRSKKGDKEVDIRPLLSSMQISAKSKTEILMQAVVCAQNPGLNPQLLLTAIETYLPELTPDFAQIEREEVLDAAFAPFR